MEAKHTSGPWYIKETASLTICSGSDNNWVAHVYWHPANARLIAAAPDLLAALQDIVDAVAITASSEACQCWDFSKARAAIAKALGTEAAP